MKEYTKLNSRVIDQWVEDGWEWGKPISHETYMQAASGKWSILLTPNKPVPRDWFGSLKGIRILGLASGGGQQMPILTAAGAECTVLDYSDRQLSSEKEVALREGYRINIIKADMTKPLPFADESFDMIINPVSNCYIEDTLSLWMECARILKKGGSLLAGLDNGVNYLFDESEKEIKIAHVRFPFNPLKDPKLYEWSVKNGWGIQFSHSIDEQIGGQLKAGLTLVGIFEDTNSEGFLKEMNAPTFYATKSVKPLS